MLKEDYKTEFKREFIDDIDKEIIAFLNSEGGTIYVGLNDDGSIFKNFLNVDKNELDLKIGNLLQNLIYPSPYRNVSYFFNEKGVFVINIFEGPNKPYYLKSKGPRPSGVFLRVGSSKRNASEEEILSMIMETRKYYFEEDISDNQELSFNQLNQIFIEKNIKLTSKEKRNFGILNKNNQYTNFGLIVSDQSPIEVKLAEYDNKLNFRIKKTFSGSLIKIINEVQEQAERLNDISAVIDGSSFERKETKSYPGASLREMILNAFCHANYFIKSNIKIEFFEDKVKITSPGGIYNATLEDILNGTQTYRNLKLVHLLDKLNLIENFGTGFPRTFEAYKDTGKQPEFISSKNFFIVSLPNLNYKDDRQINRQINDLGISILRLINLNPGIKVSEIFEILKKDFIDLNINKIRYELKTELKGLIELKGSKKTGGYHIIEF